MRDYRTMRWVLKCVAGANKPLELADFVSLGELDAVGAELRRLRSDGLVSGNFSFDRDGAYLGGTVGPLTDEGAEFLRLIENESVWAIVRDTLETAGVDVSYPLLKEVCEEIVKRYVTGFIPEM